MAFPSITASVIMQAGEPNNAPAIPDGTAITAVPELMTLLSYIRWIGVAISLMTIFYGASTWGLGGMLGNRNNAGKGRVFVITGFVGVLLLAAGPIVINSLIEQTTSG